MAKRLNSFNFLGQVGGFLKVLLKTEFDWEATRQGSEGERGGD
jgi:hypothetical protein